MSSLKNSPLVSVIIPAYKAESFIEETLRSVVMQTYQNLEIIVVDDGSPDGQVEIVEKLKGTDSRIILVRQENGGVSMARNNGFAHASGEYLSFLDADDVWLPQMMERVLKKFHEADYALVHCHTDFIDRYSHPTGRKNIGLEGEVLDELLLWDRCVISGPSSAVIRRKALEDVGLFDPQFSTAADQEMWIRIAAKYKIGLVQEPLVLYRSHGKNMSLNVALLEKDHTGAYIKAESLGLFKSGKFKNQCFSNMYLIIGACWWGDGSNKLRGTWWFIKALWKYPPNILKVLRKIGRKLT